MWKLLVLAGFWVALGSATALPRLLEVIPRGVVVQCSSQCGLEPTSSGRGRSVNAHASISLRDGRWVELGGSDFPCECSCDARPTGPSWCLPPGGFIEKRRWELEMRTSDGPLPWGAGIPLSALMAVLVLVPAVVLGLHLDRSTKELFSRHPAGGWLSGAVRRLQAALAYPLLLAVPALMLARVLNPLAYALAGLPWVAGVGLVRWFAAHGGSTRLLLLSARRIARRHPDGAVRVGCYQAGLLTTASGERILLDPEQVMWLDRHQPPADGSVVEAIGGLRPEVVAPRRIGPALVPLEERPPLCRVRRDGGPASPAIKGS